MLPLAMEGGVVAVLIGVGVLAPRGASSIASAAFPLDAYFDLKQSLAFSHGWPAAIALLSLSVLVRGSVLAGTLWLAEAAPGPFAPVWARACKLAGLALIVLVPAAVLYFAGVAMRYAPFVWAGALAGLYPAVAMARRAVRLDVGRGVPPGSGVPEVPGWLAYAYLVTLLGAGMSVLGTQSSWGAGLLVGATAPLHAVFVLGWRDHLVERTYPGGGTWAVTATALAVLGLGAFSSYDRFIRDPPPVATLTQGRSGTLLTLGGVDTTLRTGAIAELDPRDLGFARGRSVALSYRSGGRPYSHLDTRGDLREVARSVAGQLQARPRPRIIVGHSQAALVLDAIAERDLAIFDRAAVFSAPPRVPPHIDAAHPGQRAAGRPASDLTRVLAGGLRALGLPGFDLDAPGSPPQQLETRALPSQAPRLAVWALGDSVWLDGDWRRAGELNVVAISDHVGTTNNARAVAAVRDFLAGRVIQPDDRTWRGMLAAALSHAFAPWRPG